MQRAHGLPEGWEGRCRSKQSATFPPLSSGWCALLLPCRGLCLHSHCNHCRPHTHLPCALAQCHNTVLASKCKVGPPQRQHDIDRLPRCQQWRAGKAPQRALGRTSLRAPSRWAVRAGSGRRRAQQLFGLQARRYSNPALLGQAMPWGGCGAGWGHH